MLASTEAKPDKPQALHIPEFTRGSGRTLGADRGMVGVLFEMVNSASNVTPDGARQTCCAATQTRHRQEKYHVQIQHNATRSSATRAWLVLNLPMHATARLGARAAALTQPLQDEKTLSPLELRQKRSSSKA
jgi:hypothetical protein